MTFEEDNERVKNRVLCRYFYRAH